MIVIVGYEIQTWRVNEIVWRETATVLMRRYARSSGAVITEIVGRRSFGEVLSYQGTYSPKFAIDVILLSEALDLIGSAIDDLEHYREATVHTCLHCRFGKCSSKFDG